MVPSGVEKFTGDPLSAFQLLNTFFLIFHCRKKELRQFFYFPPVCDGTVCGIYAAENYCIIGPVQFNYFKLFLFFYNIIVFFTGNFTFVLIY